MELSINAYLAQELSPLWRYIEQRVERAGLRILNPARPLARSVGFTGDRARRRPITKRLADSVASARSKSHRRIQNGESAIWNKQKTDITIVVLALDAYNAKVYHDMLEVRGYSAVTASNVDSWIGVLGECQPDLILIDLCSSDHPSIDAARTIMKDPRYSSVPVIIVTDAYKSGDLNDPTRIIVDCDGRIIKPVSVEGFYGPIEAILKHSAIRRTIRQ